MEKRRTSIGMAVDQCIKESTEEWFRQHAGMRSREEAAAADITLISSTVELRPGGRLGIFVGVTSRRQQQSQMDWYRYERRGRLGYVPAEPTRPKA